MNDKYYETFASECKLRWDEGNRLLASDDNGFVTNYWYDAILSLSDKELCKLNDDFACLELQH